jgi:hypothetical protein
MDSGMRNEIGKKGELTARTMFSHETCAKPYVDSVFSFYSK